MKQALQELISRMSSGDLIALVGVGGIVFLAVFGVSLTTIAFIVSNLVGVCP